MGEEELEYIREHYEAEEQPIEEVNLGFPQLLLDIDGPLDEILRKLVFPLVRYFIIIISVRARSSFSQVSSTTFCMRWENW